MLLGLICWLTFYTKLGKLQELNRKGGTIAAGVIGKEIISEIPLNNNRMRGMTNEPFHVNGKPGAGTGVHILTAKGPITFASSSALVDAVLAVTEPRLVIDLTDVPSVDSMAVGALVRSYVHCQKSGRRLAFVGMGPRVTNVLRLTGVDPLFEMYATVGEAEAALA